jgi:hypothetical protein
MKNIPIETRSNAKAAGRKIYFTGKECKHGHITYRYVDSGTCSECINGNNRKARGDTSAQYQYEKNEERRAAIGQLIQVAICVQAQDVPEARDVAAALCLARFPCLSLADVTLGKPPQKWATNVPKNHFLIPAQDLETMRAIESNLLARHKVDFTHIRKIQADLAAVVNSGGTVEDYFKNT